ncbi:MAG: transcription elongation factor GreA [Bernardetiaceae bacterium]|nr:transcription elongation factor GreA [Bernardetiaceae bacterium]
MASVNYYTKEGLEKLKNELHELRTKGRSAAAREIAEAREKGDLKENAEYDAAKEAQGILEMKIAKLEQLVGNARIIDESKIDASKVAILSKVKIRNTANKMELEYMLVAEEEADLKQNKISVQSPIGKGLLGKSKGDIAEIKAPRGTIKFEILDIAR